MQPDQILREKVEVLDGSRSKGAAQKRAAVRVEDMDPLLRIPQLQATEAAGSTPTADEYAALLNDVRAVHAALTDVAAILRGKLL